MSEQRTANALKAIEAARAAIISVAAQMARRGIDTSPLTEPVAELQRAVAELQALDREVAHPTGLKN